METTNKSIFLPLDFSDISPVAIEHAVYIAQQVKASLHVRHWVKRESELQAAQETMSSLIDPVNDRVDIDALVAVGDFMKEIPQQIQALEPMLAVIGTHGLQGMEHIVGTHAIRLISSSQVPFLVVQEKGVGPNGYENIVVPMELQRESKQKLQLVAQLAEIFDSSIHIVSPREDDEFLSNALKRNLVYAETFLERRKLDYTTTLSQAKSSELDDAVFPVVKEKNADLIAITNWHSTKVLGVIGTDDTQDIIINKDKTPVLVINPSLVSADFDLFGTTA